MAANTLKPNKRLATKSVEIELLDDLLREIFVRLPSNLIKRFRTTSKQWESLLSDSTFRKQWRKRNHKPSTGLILRTTTPVASTYVVPLSHDKPIPPLRTDLEVKQSCNGLLLCSSKNEYHVYNPTTNTCRTLPKLGNATIRSMSLAFDPIIFGHCYKVICCVRSDTWLGSVNIHVYSSDTGLWVNILKLFNRPVNDEGVYWNGVYWNGCIHWLSELAYFDIKNATLNELPVLPVGLCWKNNHCFGESCGRLVYVRLLVGMGPLGSCRVDVCEMKKDYSEWVYKCKVHLDNQYWCTSVLSVLSVMYGLEVDDLFLVLKTREGIGRYSIVSETFEELPVSLTGGIVDHVFQYIESQYCVN